MAIILVPDPTYTGKADAPLMPRAWAMRKLHESGSTVGEVARFFEVPFSTAYKAIQPPRQAVDSPRSTAPKPLTQDRIAKMTRTQLEAIAYQKQRIKVKGELRDNPAFNQKRVEAATAELEKRGVL